VCTPCRAGSIAPAGSRFAADCLCSPLHYTSATDGSCQSCPSNSAVSPFNVSDTFPHAGGDVSGWEGVRSVTDCGSAGTVLGGYNQLGRSSSLRKTYSGLCGHNRVGFAFAFLAIDGWAGESAELFVDNVLVWSKIFSNGNTGDIACGGPQGDSMAFETQLVVPHSVRQMTVEFRTSLAKSPFDASWGLTVFSVGALCSGETASACNSGMPAPGNYAGPVDGKSAVLGLVSAVIDEKYTASIGF